MENRASHEAEHIPNEKVAERPDADSPTATTVASRNESDWEYITGIKLFMAIAVVTLVVFIMLLDSSIIASAIPRITSDFHSLGDIGWYGSSYLLANCVLQPITGKLYARFSSKWTYMVFIFIFELGSMISALATSSKRFIVGRAIAGMGGSGIVNGALTIIAAVSPLHKRAAHLGFIMSFGQIGILVGPLIGGALTQYTTWRWCFWINLPCGGLTALILFFIHIPDRRTSNPAFKDNVLLTLKSLDLFGFFLFAPAAIMLLLALQWGGTQYSWGSATIIGLFCGAGGNFLIFLAWEYKRGDEAMIPYSMVKMRIVWCSCLLIFFFFGAQILTSYYLALYFQSVKGVSPTLSGVYLLPTILSQMLLAIISGVMVGRVGYYLPFSVFSCVLASIGSGLMSTFKPSTTTGIWIGYQIIAATGRGAGISIPTVAVQNAIPQTQVSVGMSLIAFTQTLGGAMFLSFAQTALNAGLTEFLPKYVPGVSPQAVAAAGASQFRHTLPPALVPGVIEAYSRSISHVFWIIAGCSVVSFFLSFGIGWKSVKKAADKIDENSEEA